MSECTLNKHGYSQVIEDDIDFLDRHIPEGLKGHPLFHHVKLVLQKSIELLYPDGDYPQGWVARDKFRNGLHLFTEKPYRGDTAYEVWRFNTGNIIELNEKAFPDLKWEDEPIRVEIKPIDE
jgi:hypothetical protein